MNAARLPRCFHDRPTLVVARELLGKVLVYMSPQGTPVALLERWEPRGLGAGAHSQSEKARAPHASRPPVEP